MRLAPSRRSFLPKNAPGHIVSFYVYTWQIKFLCQRLSLLTSIGNF